MTAAALMSTLSLSGLASKAESMLDNQAARDSLREQFKIAVEHAYDLSEALHAFWLYALPLMEFELRTSPCSLQDALATARQRLNEINKNSFPKGLRRADAAAIS